MSLLVLPVRSAKVKNNDAFWFLLGLLGICCVMPCLGMGMTLVPLIRANGTTMSYTLICVGVVALLVSAMLLKDWADPESPLEPCRVAMRAASSVGRAPAF